MASKIARRVQRLTELLAAGLRAVGAKVNAEPVFDTLTISNVSAARVHAAAEAKKINLRRVDDTSVGLSLDETTTVEEVADAALVLLRVRRPQPHRARHARRLRRALRARFGVPHASDLQPLPHRARDAPLHQAARSEGPLALPLDDLRSARAR